MEELLDVEIPMVGEMFIKHENNHYVLKKPY